MFFASFGTREYCILPKALNLNEMLGGVYSKCDDSQCFVDGPGVATCLHGEWVFDQVLALIWIDLDTMSSGLMAYVAMICAVR